MRGSGLREGLLTIGNRTYRLGAVAGGLWAAVGIAPEETPGLVTVAAQFSDDIGEDHQLAAMVTVRAYDFPIDYVDLPPAATAGIDAEGVAEENRIIQVTFRGFSPAGNGVPQGFQWPIQGVITTMFGEARVYNGNTASVTYHRGMDIAANEGAPVHAAAAGQVAFAGQVAVRGNYIIIDHGLGVFTGYGHLSQLNVRAGDSVTPDTVIGLVGTTGLSTGPHLHWEAAAQGVFFDPQDLLDGALR